MNATTLTESRDLGMEIERQHSDAPPPPARHTSSTWRRHVPKWSDRFVGTIAVICAIAAVGHVLTPAVQPVRTFIDIVIFPTAANFAYAAFTALLAVSLGRRKRLAWTFLVLLLIYNVLGDVIGIAAVIFLHLTGHDAVLNEAVRTAVFGDAEVWLLGIGMVISVVTLWVVLTARKEFFAPVRRGSLGRAVLTLLAGIAVGVAVGCAWVYTIGDDIASAGRRFVLVLDAVLGGAVSFNLRDRDLLPPLLHGLLGLIGAFSLLAAIYVLFRTQKSQASLPAADEVDLRLLLDAYGSEDSLSYFSTRRDKSVVFAPDRRAAVTYRVEGDVLLASGDPVGDPAAWDSAVRLWTELAERYAWVPAVIGASEKGAHVYAEHGLRVLEIGDEAILHARTYDLANPGLKQVRQATARLERDGYSVRIRRHADIPAEHMHRVMELANTWRVGEDERGFSMALSRLGDPADGPCVLVEALDEHGEPRAFLSFVPWGSDGLSLDLMRRDPTSPNGIVEFIVSGLMAQAGTVGVTHVSLNFAVFRSAFAEGGRIGAGPVARAWRSLLLFFSRWWQLESLYRSNMKYTPDWSPRFLCFPERSTLAKVGLAAGRAEGFVNLPFLREQIPDNVDDGGEVAQLYAREKLERAPLVAAPSEDHVGDEQTRNRKRKVERLARDGVEAYPVGVPRTHRIGDLAERYAAVAANRHIGVDVSIVGRVMGVRRHAAITFWDLQEWSGTIQVVLPTPELRQQAASMIDMGDWVSVTGEVMTTRTGELSVEAESFVLAAACLHPLPNKRTGLVDPDLRVRQRSVDLMMNADSRGQLQARSRAVTAIRNMLTGDGYLEVETPILQTVHGGANARPFVTHINAYDMQLYMRIAPELFLKRLLVGGVEKVFEIGRNFRNEGVDFKHNPEFTSIEAYHAHGDYWSMLKLTEEMIRTACIAVHGSTVFRHDGEEVDLGADFPVKTVHGAISEALGEQVSPDTTLEQWRRHAGAAGIETRDDWSSLDVLEEVYDELVEAKTRQPTFYLDYPTEKSPLTRQHRVDPRLAERWDLVAFGSEIGCAYSELVDPMEQRRRLTAQSLLAAGGDPEAMELDEDFLAMLEYAMPPTGGMGMGIDRLVMLLTGKNIRDTIAFPLVRPGSR